MQISLPSSENGYSLTREGMRLFVTGLRKGNDARTPLTNVGVLKLVTMD